MNKKFLSAILFGALMVTSTGTFVSCKDYDEDIDSLQTQVDASKADCSAGIQTLNGQVASLQTALSAAQSTADAAKKAAAAAQTTGDAALAAAEVAKAAAAQAKADAIADAIAEVQALKAWVMQGYVTNEALAEALLPISAKITAIENGLDEIWTYINEKLSADDQSALKAIMALQEDLAIQEAALAEFDALLEELQAGNDELYTELASTREELQEAVTALNNLLEEETKGLWEEIALARQELSSAITALTNLQADDKAKLMGEIEEILKANKTTSEILNAIIQTQADDKAGLMGEIEEILKANSALQATLSALYATQADDKAELMGEIEEILKANQVTSDILNAIIQTHGNDKVALQGAIDALTESLDEKIANLEDKLGNADVTYGEEIAALAGEIEELVKQDVETANNISALYNVIADLEAAHAADKAAIEKQIADLKAELTASITAQIAALNETIAANMNDELTKIWEALASNTEDINKSITMVYNHVLDLQGNLATLHMILNNQLTSLAFIPEVINHHGLGVVEFYTLELKDANKKTVYVSNIPTATYRVNPTNAAQADYTWSFINRAVTTRAAGDAADLLTVTKSEAAAGSRTFWLQVNKDVVDTYAKDSKDPIFALKAANGEREIVSDYATVTINTLKNFALAQLDEEGKKVKYYNATLPADGKEADKTTADLELVYTSTLDLKPIVEAWTKDAPEDALVDLNVEGIKYEFTKVEEYLGADEITDQQKFITLENGVVAVDKNWLNKGTAAIGRTPVIKAVATVNGLEIATAYIKIEIIEKEAEKPVVKEDLLITVDLGEIEYSSIKGEYVKALSWADANAKIYDVLGLTKDTFADKYTVNGFGAVPAAGVKVSANINKHDATTETAFAEVVINNKVKFGEDFALVIIESNNRYAYPNVAIKFTYNIVHTQKLPELNEDYLIAANTIQVKGKMVDGSWKLISEMKEHFDEYLANYTEAGNHSKLFFRMKKETPAQTGADITLNKEGNYVIQLTKELDITEEHRDYNVQAVLTLANGEECVKDYVVRFVRPFNATVGAMTLKTFVATADTKDLAELVVIKDLDEKVVYEKGKYTEYGKETYKLDKAGIDFKYGFNADDTFGGKLTIKDSQITWDNGGADLQKDKTAKSEVTINIPAIATIKVEGVITVLSTEHSK